MKVILKASLSVYAARLLEVDIRYTKRKTREALAGGIVEGRKEKSKVGKKRTEKVVRKERGRRG